MNLIKKNKNFRFLLLGSLISGLGDYFYDIAITLLIYDITKTIDSIAYMWISKGALRIIILYLGGLITDKFNRKWLIVITNLISVPIALTFLLIDKNTLWIAYIGVFLLQSINDIDSSSENAILPELIDKDDLPKANTIFSFTNQILMLISLAVSGLIYNLMGADILFIINAISFLIAGLCFQLIKFRSSKSKAKKAVKLFDASVIKFLKGSNILVFTLIGSTLVAIIARTYDVTNILIADTKLGITSTGIIYFRYALAVGGLLVPFAMKLKLSKKTFESFILFSATLVVSIMAFGLCNNLILTLLILVGFGFTSSLQGIYFRSILQESVETDYLGRVFSFFRIVFTAISVLTVAIIPVINNFIKVEWLYLGSGIPILILLGFIIIKYKKFLNLPKCANIIKG